MCRIAAFVGPPVPLSSLLYDPPHSLERQAYRPRELVHGSVNVDGTGVAWWNDGEPEPLRYVGVDSPWADPNLPALTRRISSHAILAAVRSATPGLAFGPDHVAPFAHGGLAGAHNGRVDGFRGPVGRAMVSSLPDDQWADLGVLNDSRALFLAVAAAYEGDLALATRTAIDETTAILDAHDAGATLNLVVADGTSVVASRHSVRAPINSLYTAGYGDSHLVASEPLDDDPAWKPVPEGHLVAVTANSVTISPLE
jgi:glutamine amidotransferase